MSAGLMTLYVQETNYVAYFTIGGHLDFIYYTHLQQSLLSARLFTDGVIPSSMNQ